MLGVRHLQVIREVPPQCKRVAVGRPNIDHLLLRLHHSVTNWLLFKGVLSFCLAPNGRHCHVILMMGRRPQHYTLDLCAAVISLVSAESVFT